ncbi:unnamed protein product [Bursaphelenchus okinawaensis]|uniref:COP9 signalosome complex subunit 3 n=1 Tax=Bursaphelenchus okinawaensis TaxID=465554 RepID=A0A811KVH7_9BILA|nr:unnamed protein product [Bursaphelenchus okinawaensis]CAG9112909.1 unnamed protein product [Bursaphelenchus okinawaensis]
MVSPMQTFMGAANQYGNVPLKDICDALKKALPTLNKANVADMDKFIEVLVNKNNGVGACFLLHAKIKKGPEILFDRMLFLTQVNKVLDAIQESEIEHLRERFAQTFTDFALLLVENGMALNGINLLRKALDLMTANVKGTITNLHTALLGLCLAANRFDAALDYLNVNAEAVFMNAVSNRTLDGYSTLLFFYYGGTIYIALEMWKEAAFFLQMAVCLPALSASSIMIEALKKLILVNLLLDRPVQLPSYRSAAIQRAAQSKCEAYYRVAIVYNDVCNRKKASKSKRSFAALFEKERAKFKADKNFGLVHKVYENALLVRARQLSQTFTRLKLAEVPKYLEFADESVNSSKLLTECIERGQVSGRLDLDTNSVFFDEVAETPVDSSRLEEAMQNCVFLSDILYKCHREMNLHPTYLQKSYKKAAVGSVNQYMVNMEDEGVVAPSASS